VLDWPNRRGANEPRGWVAAQTTQTFRVQKVYPFVLGRYTVHFSFIDGKAPDRPTAWGSWPRLLRLRDGQPVRAGEANPVASLFGRLTKVAPLGRAPVDESSREIDHGGDDRVRAHPAGDSARE
jgi:hypothetical protein